MDDLTPTGAAAVRLAQQVVQLKAERDRARGTAVALEGQLARVEALADGVADRWATRLADESFRHSWDMSDERRVGGAWVAGLCCECGEFVPYGKEIGHVAEALAPIIREAQAEAWDEALGRPLSSHCMTALGADQ